jgi:hypothetical protein
MNIKSKNFRDFTMSALQERSCLWHFLQNVFFLSHRYIQGIKPENPKNHVT